jgi:hypothetical protein
MKTILLLLTSLLVLAAPVALAQQDACSKQYGACMDRCSSRPQSAQGSCAQSCEANSNQCYVGLHGQPPAAGQATVAEPARDAQGSAQSPAEVSAAPAAEPAK